MNKRRLFLKKLGLGVLGIGLIDSIKASSYQPKGIPLDNWPVVLSTWNFGLKANQVAWNILSSSGKSIDAVEQGVRLIEADENNHTVGKGAFPDRDGIITLDACIMDENGNAGAVAALENIVHPISVARRVMEDTPHVMLVGDGALQFAKNQGFKPEDLHTKESIRLYEEWKKESKYKPIINIENHDTISMLAIDEFNNISGACTTSGLAYKMHGRVGDSPIIGAGMYVDNEVGGACATGHGEFVMKTLGSFLIVEFMRNGMHPQEACKKAIDRIVAKYADYKKIQIGYLAINKKGETGAYSLHKGFSYALYQNDKNKLLNSDYFLK